MTVREAVDFLENYPIKASRPGLERIRVLMEKVGNPQKGMRFVHVTGTNGKGSTCAFLDSVLRKAGYRTGLYTSPHLEHYLERIRVDGKMAEGRNLSKAAEQVKQAAESMEDIPTWFEVTTAVAFLYFRYCRCDIVVLEVGMGGEFDATNVIDCPEVAVLTNIGLEHTQILGKTVREIARTKSGIIKQGCSAVCYDGDPAAVETISERCAEMKVPLRVTDFTALKVLRSDLNGQSFIYRDKEYSISLLGSHQARNAAAALDAVEALRKKGWSINEADIRSGMEDARWPARFEVLARDPLFILDGGHNPQCALALTEAVRELLPGMKPVFLTGVLADKDYDAITEIIRPVAGQVICLTPVSERALGAEQYAESLRRKGLHATEYEDIPEGIRAALAAGRDQAVVAFGSLYLAGSVRGAFKREYRRWLRKDRDALRRKLPEDTRKDYSERIIRHILDSGILDGAGTVMLYRAIGGEADLNGLVPELKRRGKRVLYPVCIGDGEMVAKEPAGEESWQRGRYGIAEPGDSSREVAPEEIDLIFCPCTAFDRRCNRMGRGSGFYDRFLPKCEKASVVTVAFEFQRVEEVPGEPWDMPADRVITEQNIYCAESLL